MVNTSIAVLLIAATFLTSTSLVFLDNAQSQMTELNTQFSGIMNQTTGFLDNAWNVAQQFQNPDYHYNPSELGNYTNAEISSNSGK
jgi:hypothetical protein